jgi:general stress protein 26
MEKIKEKALKLANKKIAFVGSINKNNSPNIKAMLVVKHDRLKTFYFASNNSEMRTEQYKHNNSACIYFNGGIIYKGLMLEGTMEILNDETNKKLIWKNGMKSAYKNGQFLVDRIASISCEGRTIQNPKQFLWDMYINSPLYKTQQAVNEHADEIRALVFLSRADGRMLKNEREIIVRYIDLVAPGIDAEAVEKTLKNTACDLAEFNKILKRAKSWGPDIKKLVMDAASQLFALKKQPDPMEQGAFEKLKAILDK